MKPCENLSLEDMEGEVWKDVVGYEGLYKVSNLGRVKSLDRYVIISDIPRYRKSKMRGTNAFAQWLSQSTIIKRW